MSQIEAPRGFEFQDKIVTPELISGYRLELNILDQRPESPKSFSVRSVTYLDAGRICSRFKVTHPVTMFASSLAGPGLINAEDHAEIKDLQFLTFGGNVSYINNSNHTLMTITSTAPIIFMGDTREKSQLGSEIYSRFGAWLANGKALYRGDDNAFYEDLRRIDQGQLYTDFLIDSIASEARLPYRVRNGYSHWANPEFEKMKTRGYSRSSFLYQDYPIASSS